MNIEEVAESIYRLVVQQPEARYVFAVYLIDEGGGVVIEPGPASMASPIQEGMKRLGMKGLSYIIPTHIHLDHGGGSGKLAELFPQAKVVLHPRSVKHILNPSRLIEGTKMVYGDDFESIYGPILPVPESQIVVPEDGEVLDVGGRELQIFYAPGHAHHQIVIYDKETGGLFCGEALGVPIPGIEGFALPGVSVQDFNPDQYLETIEKIKRLAPRMLYYSHDGGVRKPAQLIDSLAHNAQLLRDVTFEGLKNGDAVEAIEKRAGELLPGLLSRNRGAMSSLEETILGFATYYRRKGLI